MAKVGMQDSLRWLDDPYADWPERFPGRKAIGYFCSYVPLEILHAAGLTPVRILQLGSTAAAAHAHFPAFSCAMARTALERLVSSQLGFLNAVVFAHTCDTMQCLADAWRMVDSSQRVLHFSLPTTLDAAGSVEYVLNAHHQLLGELELLSGVRVSEEALLASIALYEERRRLLAELYRARESLGAGELWRITVAGLLMPVEEHLTLLGRAISSLSDAPARFGTGPRLAVAGTALHDGSLLELIEELGGQVVADNLCTGERAFQGQVDLQHHSDALAALTARALERPICPAKHKVGQEAAARILELVRSSRADGVVFVQPKYCDPCAFDYVPQRKALEVAGIPHVVVETETGACGAQARTRLQALLEMLS